MKSTPAGEAIQIINGRLQVPDHPVIPFVEGDGTGRDIWRASVRVFDAAVALAYGGKRKIEWLEVLAGEKAFHMTGNWLPDETIETFQKYLVGIKGPLTTPVGGGIRSLKLLCVNISISTFVSDRFATLPVFHRRSNTPKRSIW